tara:strand:+ start:860 stop:1321 length:462 start_codon:yes stop_codon:yes gene_type:complete
MINKRILNRSNLHCGHFSKKMHFFPVRVYYEDTDSGGVVYYANYLKFAERARTEMMRLLAPRYQRLVEKSEMAFAVRHCEVDFLAPAKLDDNLEVKTELLKSTGVVIEASQTIRRDKQDLVSLKVRLACVNKKLQPTRMPQFLNTALRKFFNG